MQNTKQNTKIINKDKMLLFASHPCIFVQWKSGFQTAQDSQALGTIAPPAVHVDECCQ